MPLYYCLLYIKENRDYRYPKNHQRNYENLIFQEYAALLAENKKLHPNQKKARAEMMELLTAKHNTERILGITEDEKRREQRQEER